MIGGLVLAAGAGSRFGASPKLLAELDGRPLLEHAVASQCAAGQLERVVVVLGADAAAILAAVDFGRAEPVICEDWAVGRSASLRLGAAVLVDAERIVITLGDEPLVSTEAIRRVLAVRPPARAVYRGIPGHPVVLGRNELAEIGRVTGDRGASELLARAAMVECADLGIALDVDTPDDLHRIRLAARRSLAR